MSFLPCSIFALYNVCHISGFSARSQRVGIVYGFDLS
jgi:hypothetical protein